MDTQDDVETQDNFEDRWRFVEMIKGIVGQILPDALRDGPQTLINITVQCLNYGYVSGGPDFLILELQGIERMRQFLRTKDWFEPLPVGQQYDQAMKALHALNRWEESFEGNHGFHSYKPAR